MGLGNLRAPPGARKKSRKRVGRGPASGTGGTAGRGHKGQRSRSGVALGVGFEGGQMPLQRRMPKRGFTNLHRRQYAVVNLGQLERFEPDAVVDPAALHARGLIRHVTDLVKILANGKLDKALTVRAQAFSKIAREKIESAGGKAEVIDQVRRKKKSAPDKEG